MCVFQIVAPAIAKTKGLKQAKRSGYQQSNDEKVKIK
jgi:hypothetical protein